MLQLPSMLRAVGTDWIEADGNDTAQSACILTDCIDECKLLMGKEEIWALQSKWWYANRGYIVIRG